MDEIRAEHINDLALGSVFLATGGGGDPYVPTLITKKLLGDHGSVKLIDTDQLEDNSFVVTVGSVGAPTVSLELLPSVDEAKAVIDAYETHIGRKIDAIASFEIGGGNSLIPIAAAFGKNIPVIDGDGMGRALPEAQMMSYPIAGVKPTPALARDYAGNTALFNTSSTDVYERHIRSFSNAAGGMITAAEHPMTGRQLKNSIIPGTLSFAIKLGKLLREVNGQADDFIGPLTELFEMSIYGEFHKIFTGKVTDKITKVMGGYDVGEVTIEPFDGQENKILTINIKNEFLLARLNDKVVASVPDLIIIVDFETGQPINAERLSFGQRVTVFAVGCPKFYRSETALKVVHPRCFGFDIDYVPLEDLAS